MYQRITGEDPYEVPFRIYPAPHYTMGGLWVDYHCMTTIPGLFAIGEANFSDHGANRLGASALMQGLADGYFVLPATIMPYLAGRKLSEVDESHAAFSDVEGQVTQRVQRLLAVDGKRTVASFHRALGRLLWGKCGLARERKGLRAAVEEVKALRAEFWDNVSVPGSAGSFNQALEEAFRVADYMELGELLCRDALDREESCGAHLRTEYQTPDGEALRDDVDYCYSAAWDWRGPEAPQELVKEELVFENVKLATRSYK
jgi:succinate dehydrogenase / fumarate reductase, flavoprotein subunit